MSSDNQQEAACGQMDMNAKERPPETAGSGGGRNDESAGSYQPAETLSPTRAGAGAGIPVVGLGGSAGALDSFKAFFTAMGPDSGAAFVVIQHLAPAHESLLPELLAQHTSMKVAQAQDATPVEPNCVYVIPPGHDLGIRDGILCLTDQVMHGGIRMPIDFFFRSLAQDQQERAICVVFSGAGSDGTLGVRAIRGAGGLTIAQDPQTAQYGDMPRSAIATKLVDYVLPPDQIPQAITEYLRQPYVRGGAAMGVAAEGKPGGFDEVLAAVLVQTGCDFRCYKKSTILRRIERRMGLHHITEMPLYVELLRRDSNEVVQLHKDLLINVTGFFRDPEAFEEFRRNAIAPLVATREMDDPLRIWIPGCSSGEEAYSILMLIMEEMTASRKTFTIQAFATDIDDDALEFARAGIYPDSIVADVGAERLSRFFVKKAQGYQVSESLRNCVVFAAQNLITDPPFSRMDIITCRNMLIYLDADTQARLIPLFNFALKRGGYLFLGKSEGVSGQSELFDTVSKKARLYRSVTPGRPIVLDTPILPGRRKTLSAVGGTGAKPPPPSHVDAVRQALLSYFAASIVLVDRKGQILQFHGQTGKYLNMPTGEPSLNLLDIAKEGLSLRLRSALHTAINDGKSVVLDQLPVTSEQGAPCARVTVMPLPKHGEGPSLLAVIFEDVPRQAIAAAHIAPTGESETTVRRLEDELRATQQDLQSSIEELQSANEELRVSNEEVVSTNEELQSTNEELETSKEELQSINEELTTVNTQLQDKAQRLAGAYSDLANLLKSTQIATLFLDGELRVKFYTPATERVMKLIRSDMGRPISDLSTNLVGYDLKGDALAVARGGPVVERDVHHADGSIYRVRVMPYLAQDDKPEGVVATFDDVTRLRAAEERNRRLATVVTDSNDAVILADLAGSIQAWNRGASAMYGWSEQDALRMNMRDIAPPERAAALDGEMRRLAAGENVAALETKRLTKDGRVLDVWLTMTAVVDESKKIVAIASTERDITARKRAEESLAKAAEELQRSNRDLEQFAQVASHDLQEPLRIVCGFLNLLEERYKPLLDETGKEYIGYSVGGAKRMSQLITDLLAYSRVTTKGHKLELVDANAPLSAALANLALSIEDAGATVAHDELPSVVADASQLMQLFQNLIGNAVKFHHADRPCQVHITAAQQEDNWVFAVRDNGIGIAPEQFERIFVIFQRLHHRDAYAGTGIGLAICKKIVERHGGRIWVESKVGEGSTFFFTIPSDGEQAMNHGRSVAGQ